MLSIMNMHKIYKNMNSLSDNRLRISTKKMTKPLVDTFVPLTILQLLRNLSLTKKVSFLLLSSLVLTLNTSLITTKSWSKTWFTNHLNSSKLFHPTTSILWAKTTASSIVSFKKLWQQTQVYIYWERPPCSTIQRYRNAPLTWWTSHNTCRTRIIPRRNLPVLWCSRIYCKNMLVGTKMINSTWKYTKLSSHSLSTCVVHDICCTPKQTSKRKKERKKK